MTSEQFKLVEDVFFRVQQLPEDQRQAAIEEACAEDELVRREVENLLASEQSKAASISKFAHQLDDLLRSATPEPAGESLVGKRVTHYEIIRLLGQGGMGVVYLGRDVRLGRLAALKSILPAGIHTPHQLERLRREARSLAAVKHPNVATLYGIEEAHGTLFLAMEYVEGKTLADHLAGRTRLSIEKALTYCEQIAAGVEAAHDANVIHRDLKPGNVVITDEGYAKVLDFGLAQLVPSATQSLERSTAPGAMTELTRSGSFLGTPAYMSPEQARGEPVDHRSDIFSFGAILYRCLTGKSAFTGETDAELAEAIVRHEPDWSQLPERTPELVRHVLRRCLCKRPSERYRHIGDVRLELRDALLSRAWEEPPPAPPRPVRPMYVWLPWLAAIAAVVTLVMALIQSPRPRSQAEEEIIATASARRFEMTFPREARQLDPERLQVAISPDGSTIVVACATENGQQNLWMRTLREGVWRRMDGTTDALRPFFSADGQWVSFYRNSAIHQRPVLGGRDATRIDDSTNWYGATMLSDGSVIQSAGWGQPLVRIPKLGAPPERITTIEADKGESSHINPSVVPGDKWVLFNIWMGGETCDIHALNLQTGKRHLVVANGSTPRVAQAPGGKAYLLFERSSALLAMPFDIQTATVTGSPTAIVDGVLNDGTRFVAYYDVARDGTLVYIPGSAFSEENRLGYILEDRTGTTPFSDERLSFVEPRFAPDFSKLVVVIKGKLYRGYVYDLKRRSLEPILAGGDFTNADFSPDGNTLACTINKDGQYGLYLVSLIDGTHKCVFKCDVDLASDISWSPDGKYLTFSMPPKEGAARDVWIVEARENATPQPLVATSATESAAAISPDSKWIAYTSDSTGRREVYIASFPDGNYRRQLTLGGGDIPIFSPDRKYLYYRDEGGALYRFELGPDGLPIDRGSLYYAKPFGQSDPLARDYTVAPDGRVLVVEPSERRLPTTHLRAITRWYDLIPKPAS